VTSRLLGIALGEEMLPVHNVGSECIQQGVIVAKGKGRIAVSDVIYVACSKCIFSNASEGTSAKSAILQTLCLGCGGLSDHNDRRSCISCLT
jgi:hypothetical protein